jgi:mono/diheme cytochrome c family protein
MGLRGSCAIGLAGVALVALSGCSASGDHADMIAGKQLFVQKCGSCHVLARAGTKGTTGPNLDQAFQQPEKEGFGTSAIRGVVRKQIEFPARGGVMPANLVNAKHADDIAAYVSSVVAKPGKDSGLLAEAVKPAGAGKPAVASGGKLTIAADPNGQLAFVTNKATATAGKLTIDMPNQSGTPHNIAIAGKGAGKVVPKGTSSFTADFTPGTYTFLCEVPGHEQAGMKGTLTVK